MKAGARRNDQGGQGQQTGSRNGSLGCPRRQRTEIGWSAWRRGQDRGAGNRLGKAGSGNRFGDTFAGTGSGKRRSRREDRFVEDTRCRVESDDSGAPSLYLCSGAHPHCHVCAGLIPDVLTQTKRLKPETPKRTEKPRKHAKPEQPEHNPKHNPNPTAHTPGPTPRTTLRA